MKVHVSALQEELSKVRCRLCDSPPIGIFHLPEGCDCFDDPIQALCAQHHVNRTTSSLPCITLVDFREFFICTPGTEITGQFRTSRLTPNDGQ